MHNSSGKGNGWAAYDLLDEVRDVLDYSDGVSDDIVGDLKSELVFQGHHHLDLHPR